MLVKFLKNHSKWKTGETENVDTTQGNYLIRMRVAEPVDANPKQTEEILLNHLEENKEPDQTVNDTNEEFNDDQESSEDEPENNDPQPTDTEKKIKKTRKKKVE